MPPETCAVVLITIGENSVLVWKSQQLADLTSSLFITVCMVKVSGSNGVPACALT